jgi:hypothetical protein
MLKHTSSGYFGSRHTHNPLAHIMADSEKQRLQQSDSISSGSTVAPGGGGCDNKAYDPEETSEGSSIASCAHSPHLNGKKDSGNQSDTLDSATTVDMEMSDLTPPQHPKIITNSDKIHHPNDFYVSVNEHKKGMLGGEKLYVTKDNRESRQNNCRSVVCITVVVFFVAAAIAVAALIGSKLKQLLTWVMHVYF